MYNLKTSHLADSNARQWVFPNRWREKSSLIRQTPRATIAYAILFRVKFQDSEFLFYFYQLFFSVRLNKFFNSVKFVVLDDMGSSRLSLNYRNNLLLLCYQPGETISVNTVEAATASVQNNVRDSNGTYMRKWQTSVCLLNPGLDDSRLSGT